MLLTMSLTGGVLILLAALIRRFALGKMPKGLFLLLWGVALARLLIPFPALYPVPVPLPAALAAPAMYRIAGQTPTRQRKSWAGRLSAA